MKEGVGGDEVDGVDAAELVAVLVGVPVAAAESVLAAEREGNEETLRMDAMLRPRKVMLDTAASASPDSHSVDRSTPLEITLEGMSCVTFT